MNSVFKGSKPLTLKDIAEMAAGIVLQTGYAVPHLFIQGKKGVTVTMLSGGVPDSRAEKQRFFRFAGESCKREAGAAIGELTDVFFTIEAWMVKLPNTPQINMSEIVPSEHPERVEVVIVTHKDVINDRLDIEMFEMKRNAAGELIELQQMSKEGGEVRGESNLLDAFVEG